MISKDQLPDGFRRAILRVTERVCQHHIPLNYGCLDCKRKGPRFGEALNAPLAAPQTPVAALPASRGGSGSTKGGHGAPRGKRRKSMNQTEAAFAQILEARMRAGQVVSYEYEGFTLRWGKLDNIQYTPDFTVFESLATVPGKEHPAVEIVFIETKGAHIWAKDMAKFKQARNEWPLFRFELWQRKGGQWTHVL